MIAPHGAQLRPSPVSRRSALIAHADIRGFYKSATLEHVRRHGHVATPAVMSVWSLLGDGEPFEDEMTRLFAHLREQRAEAAKLDDAIADNPTALGSGYEQ